MTSVRTSDIIIALAESTAASNNATASSVSPAASSTTTVSSANQVSSTTATTTMTAEELKALEKQEQTYIDTASGGRGLIDAKFLASVRSTWEWQAAAGVSLKAAPVAEEDPLSDLDDDEPVVKSKSSKP